MANVHPFHASRPWAHLNLNQPQQETREMSVGDDEPVDGDSPKENGDEYCLEK